MSKRIIHGVYRRTDGYDGSPIARDVMAIVEQVAFDASALPVISLEYQAMADGCLIEAVIDTLDRDAGTPLTVGRAVIVPWEVLVMNGAGYLLEATRETIANLLAHEVAECLTFRGERPYNVHPHQRKAS